MVDEVGADQCVGNLERQESEGNARQMSGQDRLPASPAPDDVPHIGRAGLHRLTL